MGRAWVAAIAAVLGCGGQDCGPRVAVPLQTSATASEEPRPRRPDAVVLEPPPALPAPAVRADARGAVSLREPLGVSKVIDLVQSFLAAWQSESLDSLIALLTPDAGPIEARVRGRAGLVESWRQRLHTHEYARLAGMELVRPERIERWDRDELARAGVPKSSQEMLPGEIYVRVPLEVTAIGGEKLFEDALVMILRPDEGRFLIAAYGEVEK